MKIFFRSFCFFIAVIFAPQFLFAADDPPVPVSKESAEATKKASPPVVKKIEAKKNGPPPDGPLPAVKLPSVWKEFFFQAPRKTHVPLPKRAVLKPIIVDMTLPRRKRREPPLASVFETKVVVTNKVPAKLKIEQPRKKQRLLETPPEPEGGHKLKNGRVVYVAIPLTPIFPLPKPITEWSKDAILKARSSCQALLRNVDVTVKPIKPVRYNACGTPAPLKVSGVMEVKNAGVSLLPAATMNCAMTARFAKWVHEKLQPLAQKHFSKSVKMIHNMASYSCRHRYNDPSKKLSQHALANALDIAGFTLDDGDTVSVLKHWSDETAPEKSAFLKAVHQSACKTFVVVLGPEANDAHKNHFHFDLGRYPVCE